MANLSLNPMATTNALGSFGVQSDGYIQGVALDDPANRFNLAAGTVAATETKPLWGGLPVAELLPGTSSSPRGSYIRRAVSVAELEGFTVFNQAHNGLTTPQSPVPLYASGMSVSYYRLGSNMRVPLKASAQVVALGTSGASVKTPLAWDFVNNQITTAAAAGFAGSNIATTAVTCLWRGYGHHRIGTRPYCWSVRENQRRCPCGVQRHCGSAVCSDLNDLHLRTGNCTRRSCNHAGHHRRSYAFRHHAAGKSARHRIRQLQDCQL